MSPQTLRQRGRRGALDSGYPVTFSLLARDPRTGDLGFAVASRYPAVGGVVPYFRAGVGVVASQSVACTALAEAVLDALAAGSPPAEAIRGAVLDRDPDIRQVLAIAIDGTVAAFTGSGCTSEFGEADGDGCVAAGNMLQAARAPALMIAAYEAALDRPLPERLLAALEAGERGGGDRRGREAAALRVWPADYPAADRLPLDLRADHDADPIAVLHGLLVRRREVEPGAY